MPTYLPNDLWRHICNKQWSDAKKSLSGDADQASSIGFVDGVTKGNQGYLYNGNRYYYDAEYPLSTALRMEAPDSLILALLKADASAARGRRRRQEDGHPPGGLVEEAGLPRVDQGGRGAEPKVR